MRLNCKLSNFMGKPPLQGVFKNPWVIDTLSTIDTENQRLLIVFSLQYDDSGETKTLETVTLQFNALGQDTLITGTDGEPVEILEFLNAGGVYDVTKIVQWGIPSFTRVQDYFELTSVWTGLEFKNQPLQQLAIDWFMNTLQIQGQPVKERFEM